MIKWFKEYRGHEQDSKRTKIIEAIQQGIQIDLPKCESIKTSIRVNKNIWQQFGAFSGVHSEFVKGDLLAQALKEYMDKHK